MGGRKIEYPFARLGAWGRVNMVIIVKAWINDQEVNLLRVGDNKVIWA